MKAEPNTAAVKRAAACRLLMLAAVFCPGRQAACQPPTGIAALLSAEAALVDLIERVEPSVVAVTRLPANDAAPPAAMLRVPGVFQDLRRVATPTVSTPTGAGVVIDASGLILTQYLVVKPRERHRVTTVNGDQFDAQIRAADPRSGLAVLSVEGAELSPLPIGQAEELRKGASVVVVGNPNAVLSDGQPTASVGTVTNTASKAAALVNLNNTRDEQRGNYRTTLHHFGSLIQTDARLGWNAGGGAVVGLDGRLVGITTTASVIAGHEQAAGYAIPLNQAFRRVVEALKDGREAEYGFLGISFNAASRPDGRPGITVDQAFSGGPAGRAGLQPGDIITEIGGDEVGDSDRLQLLVGQHPPGVSVRVAFERNSRPESTEVLLGKYYAPGEKVISTPAQSWRGIRVDYPTAIPPRALAVAARQGLIAPQGCVVVSEVAPGSVSWDQGVRAGAFISHVGDVRVTSPEEFFAAVSGDRAAKNLRFTGPAIPLGE